MVLSGEQLDVGTEWFVSGGLRVRKQIVTRTHTVDIVVRREELVIDFVDAAPTSADGLTWAGISPDGPPAAPPTAKAPHVILLSEEVPTVNLATRVYERITSRSVLVSTDVVINTAVRHERASLKLAQRTAETEPTNPALPGDPAQLSRDASVEPS